MIAQAIMTTPKAPAAGGGAVARRWNCVRRRVDPPPPRHVCVAQGRLDENWPWRRNARLFPRIRWRSTTWDCLHDPTQRDSARALESFDAALAIRARLCRCA